MTGPRERFGLVKGAHRWRVVEYLGSRSMAGAMVEEYRYASDAYERQTDAVEALRALTSVKVARLINPLEDE